MSTKRNSNNFLAFAIILLALSILYGVSSIDNRNDGSDNRSYETTEYAKEPAEKEKALPVKSESAGSIEEKINIVAKEFRCACEGCGELQLIVCKCDMPRGAVEEKQFIRENLEKGLKVDEVIRLVEKKYGYRNT